MTYHMERFRFLSENVKQSDSASPSVCDGGNRKQQKVLFTTKLWDALDVPRNDNNIIRWNDDGTSVLVDTNRLEKHVMRRYPGLVQIPTIANFRRQMNWYGFEWELDDSDLFRFTHPYFRRDRKDLLCNVLTRRRSFSATSLILSSGRRSFRATRSGKKYLTKKQRSQNDESSDDESSLKSGYTSSSSSRNYFGDLTPKTPNIFEHFAPFYRSGSGQNETAPSVGNMIHMDDAPEWITYCAPYAPSEDGELLRQITRPNTRKVIIPVYFYDDTDMEDLVEDIFEDCGDYCLQGIPTVQPVELSVQHTVQHREITSIYEL